MKDQLTRNIKEIIDEYPKIQDILDEYNIGCSTCNVGTCQLKDIIEIHNLSVEQEQKLLKKIAEVIYPGQDVEIPKLNRKVKDNKLRYSPPMQKLVDEHKLIKRVLAILPNFVKKLDIEKDGKTVKEIVDFIKSYADRYHHAKEEDILFKYFDPGLDILKVMHEDHESARNHVKEILSGLEKKNESSVKKHLLEYKDLLTEHIKKEDEILYPWMDRNLGDKQIGELFSRFYDVDGEFPDAFKKYNSLVKGLEEMYGHA